GVGERTVRQVGHVHEVVGGLAAVVVVLRQVPVGQLTVDVDLGGERVGAVGAVGHPHHHDPHRLVPRRPLAVVGGGHREGVAGFQRDPVVGRGGGHRD